MNIHVTGGTGFLGPYVIRECVARGHTVTALVRSDRSARRAEESGAKPLRGDLDHPRSVEDVFRLAAPDVLINVASLGFGHAPTIITAAENTDIQRAVFVSTTSIFTKLDAPSKETRVQAEQRVESGTLEWTIVRPTMIYGARGDRNMERLLRAAQRWPIIPLPGGGKGLQQPVHVEDLARAIVVAAESPTTVGRSYDLAGPSPLSMHEVCLHAARAVGKRPRPFSVPLRPLVLLVRTAEAIGLRLRISSEQLLRLAEDKVFDISDAAADLEFRPRSFDEGIREEAAQLR